MDVMDCDVCLDGFNEEERIPRIIPCGHTTCQFCIENSLKDGEVSCPFCRKDFPAASIDDIPINFTFLKVVRALSACGNVTQNSSLPTKSPMAMEPQLHSGTCAEHGFYKTFWCRKCQVWLCHACTVVDHPSGICQVTSIKNALNKIKEDEKDLLKKVEDARSDHIEILAKYQGKLQLSDSKLEEQLEAFRKLMKEMKDMKIGIKKECKRLECCLSDGDSVLEKMTDAAKILSESETVEAITAARSASHACRKDVLNWVESSNDDLKNNVLQSSQKIHKELDIILDAANCRQDSTFQSVAPVFIACMKNVSMNCLTTKDLQFLSSVAPLWAVHNGQSRAAPLVVKGTSMYIHALRDESPPDGAVVLQYDNIRSFIEDSKEIFMEFSWIEKTNESSMNCSLDGTHETKQRTIHIQIDPKPFCLFPDAEHQERKTFLSRCSGEGSNSFLNCKMVTVLDKDSPKGKARLCCGDGTDVVEGDTENHEKGLVTLAESGSNVAFCMWYKSQPPRFGEPARFGKPPIFGVSVSKGVNASTHESLTKQGNSVFGTPNVKKIGKISSGIDLVELVATLPDVTKVRIADCGFIINLQEDKSVKNNDIKRKMTS